MVEPSEAGETPAERRPPRLAVEGVTVAFGAHRVLDGVDLAVGAGETLTILGPSGGGKTTLLRVVAGLVAPDAGRVLLDGEDLASVPTHRRGIGLVFQDHALWPHRDVAGNVGFGLRVAGVPRAQRQERVATVLELVGLAGFERRRVVDLSGGEAQRVALARSLAPEPRVLLLDEPLGALDRLLHRRLVGDLRAIIDRAGLTVVHVTHDQSEALALGDRVAVLGGGGVLQVDRPERLWRRPASVEVARFLGHRTFVPAYLERTGDDRVAISSTGRPIVALGSVEVAGLRDVAPGAADAAGVDAPQRAPDRIGGAGGRDPSSAPADGEGDVACDRSGDGTLVVRSEAVRLLVRDPGDDDGPGAALGRAGAARSEGVHRATVVASTFSGDATELELAVEGWASGATTVHTRHVGPTAPPGSVVTIAVDPAGCWFIPGPAAPGAPAQPTGPRST